MSIQRTARLGLATGFLFFVILISSLFAAAVVPPQKVVFAFGSLNEHPSALFVAKDQGFFEEQGLDPQIVQVSSGPIAMSALAAGDANFYAAAATGATLGSVAGGLDAVFIGGLINKLDGYVMVSPKIQSPVDLKGKTLGVQSIGGGLWMFTMMALDHWGLDLKRDKIQLRVIGDQPVIAQALATGTVDGAFLSYTFGKVAERHGSRILADIAKVDIPYQGTGILARRSFVDKSPELVEKSLRALIKAVAFIKEAENKPAVMRTLAKWLRLSRLQDAEGGYETINVLYNRNLLPTKEGLLNSLRILSNVDAKFARLKVDDLVDDRIARKLEKEGGF
jgi:ABC-type nitrate/sulfonate/bicarbonate transport system substrate-binding protein